MKNHPHKLPCGCKTIPIHLKDKDETIWSPDLCAKHNAAPELLAALRLAVARNEHDGACRGVGGGCICWKRDAEEAFTKAEGKS